MKETVLNAQTLFANIDDRKIAYRQFGNGTPIILANRFRVLLTVVVHAANTHDSKAV